MKTQDLAYCALMTALVAIGAFIRIPLPGEDYMTMQMFFVVLTGLLLGRKKGTLAMGAYVLIGLMGVPIFAGGGGIAYLLKPTFGYLFGFMVSAAFSGWIVDGGREKRRVWLAAGSALIIVYSFGMGYKYLLCRFYLGQPIPWSMIFLSILPMLPKDLVSCLLAALLSERLSGALSLNHRETAV